MVCSRASRDFGGEDDLGGMVVMILCHFIGSCQIVNRFFDFFFTFPRFPLPAYCVSGGALGNIHTPL